MSEFIFSANAAADLSGKQYHIMILSGENAVNQASLATVSTICGVLTNKPASGQTAAIQFGGPGRVTAGAAITAPAFITTDSSGRAVAVASGGMAIGRALQTSAATGDVIDVILMPPVRWAGAI